MTLEKLEVYDLDTWRPYCHVNDFANLIEITLKTKKEKILFEIFNAGSKENNFTKREIVGTIGKFLPTDKIEYKSKFTILGIPNLLKSSRSLN